MSTYRCHKTAGLKRGTSKKEEWASAEPAPPRVQEIVSAVVDYLDLDIEQWEVRVADLTINTDWWRDTDACAMISHGTTLQLMVHPAMGQEAQKPGRIQHQILVHEVLHFLFYPIESPLDRLTGEEPNESTLLGHIVHDLLDQVAWKLVDHIFPDINPEEDILES